METGQFRRSIQSTEKRAHSMEGEYQTRTYFSLLSLLIFCPLSSPQPHLSLYFKFLGLFWCYRGIKKGRKKKIKYESDILGSGLHALPFLANPTKAAGGSSKFLGRADNVEMLTTANLSRVSDLRTTAGDREHESNGFQLLPACL